VLAPFLRDGDSLVEALQAMNGAGAASVTRTALAAALFFVPRPRSVALAALRALRRDYGQHGFLYGAAAANEVVVQRCLFYDEVFREDELSVPASTLAAASCCQLHAQVWLGDGWAARLLRLLRPRAAAARLVLLESRARGDNCCRFRVPETSELPP